MGECRAGTAVQCSAVVLPCRPEIALPLLPSTHQLPPAIANRPLTATHPPIPGVQPAVPAHWSAHLVRGCAHLHL